MHCGPFGPELGVPNRLQGRGAAAEFVPKRRLASRAWPSQPRRRGNLGLVKPDAAHQIRKAGITAERIKEGVDSDVLQDH
jgi:hypothetical protein